MRFLVKYGLALAPGAACLILAVYLGAKDATNWEGDPQGWHSEDQLSYLATTWFFIGITLSVTFGSCIAIDDLFSALKRRREQKRLRR